MWPIATDRVVWSVGRSVYLSVTVVSPAKMAEPIEMLFGLRTWLGPRVWNIPNNYIEGYDHTCKSVWHCENMNGLGEHVTCDVSV